MRHPHIEGAAELRRYLLERYGTDWGVCDAVLASHAERAKAYLALMGFYDGSWQNIAAHGVRAAASPGLHRVPGEAGR